MKHLFVINPVAKRINGKTKQFYEMLTAFFKEHPDIHYDVFESKWSRHSLTFMRRYIKTTTEPVRIHSIGGTGTLFEVINSVYGIDNVEVAAHPYGMANAFHSYFGEHNIKHLLSLNSQVFHKTIPMDIIRCGNHYGISSGLVGIEAHSEVMGEKWIDIGMPVDISYILAGVIQILGKNSSQYYCIDIDDVRIEGEFSSLLIANVPTYGVNMNPAIDAHPDDGVMDVYLFKKASKIRTLFSMNAYAYGNYRKLPKVVSHYAAKKVSITSDKTMCSSMDGQAFYGTSKEYEINPKAINFVCPDEIDITKLPRLFGRPEEGYR